METKHCPKCEQTKSVTEFGRNATRPDGLQSICKSCRNTKAKTWYSTNSDVQKERMSAYRTQKGIKPKVLIPIPDALKAEWHPTKNGELTSDMFSAGSHEKVWWRCANGHEWESTIHNRSRSKLGCPECNPVKVIKPSHLLTEQTHPFIKEWHPTKNFDLTPAMVSAGSAEKVWWLCANGHEWEAAMYSRNGGSGCPSCKKTVSKAEHEITDYIKSLGLKVVTSSRSIIKPYELDIYVPDKKVAIEFNGVYWHTERTRPKTYHYDKWFACKQQNVQLVQIWEDEWVRNPGQVKRMIAHKLGVSNELKVFARKTQIQEITKKEATDFLNMNHVQGNVDGSIRLGLIYQGNIVAVMVFKKEASSDADGLVLNLIRYATNFQVVGGFTKLLKYAERMYSPQTVVTFSDHCVSDGGLYENNGFVADREIPPDYMYVVRGERKHKFGYRLKRFREDPNLVWDENLSERQLALLNNIPRIWDAGKTRWVKMLTIHDV